MSRVRRVVALTATIAALTLVAAPVAQAVTWGPVSSTYNHIVRVKAKGNFTNLGSQYANSSSTITDPQGDGNPVYVRTEFEYWEFSSVENRQDWSPGGSHTTPEFQNATKTLSTKDPLSAYGSRARGVIYACAQMGFPVPDSCADNPPVPTFDY